MPFYQANTRGAAALRRLIGSHYTTFVRFVQIVFFFCWNSRLLIEF